MGETVALFPLELVLLPGQPLPLHIFEPRYRALTRDVTGPGGSGGFGVVLGSSIAADAHRSPGAGTYTVSDVGTLAEIVKTNPYPDGRSDLLTVGTRRFVIRAVDPSSKPYLQAEIDYLDEEDGAADPALLARARSMGRRYSDAISRLTGSERADDIADDALRASYEIAARMQLSTTERQGLLATATSIARLHAEVALMQRELAILRDTRSVPVPVHSLGIAASLN